ncbi:hypothetical protein B0F90DRAFT_1819579 [Multifurca ochricompacta]|uniref:Uncharacterized protein n=1 Tax=Multifurca ochricompacta TaxID=376703 RepID=A0AAD4LZT4_9AGAM|nr:hypothetical protein B0F90DRAFT_1819579 [Multifurca ochricompacta]
MVYYLSSSTTLLQPQPLNPFFSSNSKKYVQPVLYTFPHSVWAAAPHLALGELGLDADPRVVNLIEGANFDPEFVKVGKSFTSTVAVINYLVSISSRKIAPETSITTVVHEDKIDPNLRSSPREMTKNSLRPQVASLISSRFGGLKKSISGVHALLNGQAPDEVKQGFFNVSTALWESIKSFIFETLPAASLRDHSSAVPVRKCDRGVAALEKRFGPVPEKVKVYWVAWIGRDSWVGAYPDNVLH